MVEVETLSNDFDDAFEYKDDGNDQQHETDGLFLERVYKLRFVQ